MLGNFTYCNPTKLYFGKGAIKYLNDELPKYGKKVVLIYGGGSIKKNGIYDEVIDILKSNGKDVAEISGVMPNPTVEKLYEGMDIARRHGADLLLAVGGGSVCDYAKALAVSVHCEGDPWEKYYIRFEEPVCPVVPVGCVRRLRAHHGGHGQRDERGLGHHQPCAEAQDRSRVSR